MPYIVSTRQPCPEEHREPLMQGDGHGWDGTSYHTPPCETCDDRCEVIVSRRAVATLQEAAEAIDAQLPDEIGPPKVCIAIAKQIVALDESGGTVALPDGTVIEVEAVTRLHLAARCCMSGRNLHGAQALAEVLAAFNAKQAS